MSFANYSNNQQQNDNSNDGMLDAQLDMIVSLQKKQECTTTSSFDSSLPTSKNMKGEETQELYTNDNTCHSQQAGEQQNMSKEEQDLIVSSSLLSSAENQVKCSRSNDKENVNRSYFNHDDDCDKALPLPAFESHPFQLTF
eukprot:12514648-Ditylum_brightwellii.AAC.1